MHKPPSGRYGSIVPLAVSFATFSMAGADLSGVPLREVESTVPYLHVATDRLADSQEHLFKVAQHILDDKGLLGKRNDVQGLFVRLDVIEIGDSSSRVVLVTTVRFQDVVAAYPARGREPWTFDADTWRWDDVAVVQLTQLSEVAVSKVTEGVSEFAESLSKAKAIARPSG
jgi:hypothetical protein